MKRRLAEERLSALIKRQSNAAVKQELRKVRRRRPKHPVYLRDEERFRLLYGPYEPPLVKRGFLVDAVRGKVKFGRFSNALIPWPKAKRQGKSGSGGFILCGDLLRALEKESCQAISHHWGVCKATVTNWRNALELKGLTTGSQRLIRMGVELAKLPESRKKIAEAIRGRVLSRSHKSRLFAGIHQGWKERFQARRAEYRRTGRFPKATKSDPWLPEEEKLLAKLPTSELVRVLGRTFKAIQARRIMLDIQPPPAVVRQPWRDDELKRLGTAPDSVIAKRLGRSISRVRKKRRLLGLRFASKVRWTADEEAIIGQFPDAEVARRLGRSLSSVAHRRRRLGMAHYHIENARPTELTY